MKITFVSHACVMIEYDGKTIVTDPFFQDSGALRRKFPNLFDPDFVLLTHGHNDHVGSLFSVLSPKTKVLGIVELCSYLNKKGVTGAFGLNFGGKVSYGDISFTLVPAKHTSSQNGVYLGEAAGFVVKVGDKTLYHAGDTDVFGDMALIERFHKPQIGFLPIGGRYTMDEEGAAYCCNQFFRFESVIPIHYDTFEEIKASPEKLASLTDTKIIPLSPGESVNI